MGRVRARGVLGRLGLAASLVAGATVTAVVAVSPPHASAANPVLSFVRSTAVADPRGIAMSADGTIWNVGGHPPFGVVENAATTIVLHDPNGITLGLDGSLWVTDSGNCIAGRGCITKVFGPSATPSTSSFQDPTIVEPGGIISGPDSALWFTNENTAAGTHSIGRITLTGTVSSFPVTLPSGGRLNSITAGPDGNLWFTNEGTGPSFTNSSIGRITPAGVVTLFTGAGVVNPYGIAAGPDGNLWFANRAGNSIGRITPSGVLTAFTDPSISGPVGIVAAVDGALWFTNSNVASIGRITTGSSPTVTSYRNAVTLAQPWGITSGAGGDLFFTDRRGDIDKVTMPTYQVNSTGDGSDVTPGDDVCLTATPGECTLRAAIQESNAHAGRDIITFNISGPGSPQVGFGESSPHIITVVQQDPQIAGYVGLPLITDPVTIDGFTQFGSHPNNFVKDDNTVRRIRIENGMSGAALDPFNPPALPAGNQRWPMGIGIGATAAGSEVRGIAIGGFSYNSFVGQAGIDMYVAGASSKLEGMSFSLSPVGLYVDTTGTGTTIGGGRPAAHNSFFRNGANANLNASDLSFSGNSVMAGSDVSIKLNNIANALIGGTAPGAGNLFYDYYGGASQCTIDESSFSSTGTRLLGNIFGLLPDGTTADAAGPRQCTVLLRGSGAIVGDGTPEGRNVFAASRGSNALTPGALSFYGGNTSVRGNYFGTDVTGAAAVPNNSAAIYVGSSSAQIGGSTPPDGNVIANGTQGVVVAAGRIAARIVGNSMYSNGDAGITLGAGSNNDQESPVLASAAPGGIYVLVDVSIADAAPLSFYPVDVDFYLADSTLLGGGKTFLGTTTFASPGQRLLNLNKIPGADVGRAIVATATDSLGNTSRFSAPAVITSPAAPPPALSFGLALTNGGQSTVGVAPAGIAVNRFDRNLVPTSSGSGSIAAASIDTIGPKDTAIAGIKIGSTPLSAIVIGSAPLSAIPLVNIDVEGGWSAIVAGTDLANQPLPTLTFGQVLRTGSPSDPGTPAGRIAALPLSAINVQGTPLSAIPLSAIALGGTPLSAIPLSAIGTGTGNDNPWCAIISSLLQPGQDCTTALQHLTLMEVTLRGVPLSAIPLSAIPLSAIDLSQSPLSAIPLSAINLGSSPLSAIPLSAIPLSAIGPAGAPLSAIPLSAIPLSAIPLSAIPLSAIPLSAIGTAAAPLSAIPLSAIPLSAIQLNGAPLSAIGTSMPLSATPLSAISTQGAPLSAIQLQGAPLSAIPLSAIMLSDTPLSAIPLSAIGTGPVGDWCTVLANAKAGFDCTNGANPSTTTLRDLSVHGVPLSAIPLSAIPLSAIPLSAIGPASAPLSAIPLSAIPLSAIPLSAIPLSAIPLSAIQTSGAPLSAIPLSAIPLSAIDVKGSPLSAIPLSAIPLSAIPLSAIPLSAIPLSAIPLSAIPLSAIKLGANPLSAIPLSAIPLSAIDVLGSPLSAIPLSAIPLSAIPLSAIPLSAIPLSAIPLSAIPLSAIPLSAIKLGANPLSAIPLSAIPLSAIDMATSPLSAIPLSAIPLSAISVDCNLVNCAAGTLGDAYRAGAVPGSTTLAQIQSATSGIRLADVADHLAGYSASDVVTAVANATVGGRALTMNDLSTLDGVTLGDLPSTLPALATVEQHGTVGEAYRAGALSGAATLAQIQSATSGIRLGDLTRFLTGYTQADVLAAVSNAKIGDRSLTMHDLSSLDDLTLGDLPSSLPALSNVQLGALGSALVKVTFGDIVNAIVDPVTGRPQAGAASDIRSAINGLNKTLGQLASLGDITLGRLLAGGPSLTLNDIQPVLGFLTLDTLSRSFGLTFATPGTLANLTRQQLGQMTLADLAKASGNTTVGQLLAGLGPDVLKGFTLGDLLRALVDPASLALGGVDVRKVDTAALPTGTVPSVSFTASYTLSAASPQPVTVNVAMPPQSSYVAGSATVAVDAGAASALEPSIDGQTLSWTFTAQPGANNHIAFNVLPTVRAGSTTLHATAIIPGTDAQASATAGVSVADGLEANDFLPTTPTDPTPQTTRALPDTVYLTYISTPSDIDVFQMDVHQNDKLVVNLSNLGADLDVALWVRPSGVGSAAALSPVSNQAPLAAITDPDASGATAVPLNDFPRLDARDPSVKLVKVSNHTGTADESFTTDRLPAGTYFVEVYGANGATNVDPAALQMKVLPADTAPACSALSTVHPMGPVAVSTPVTIPSTADTLILVNPSRTEQLYGAQARADVDAATGRLTGYLAAHPELGVNPVVVPVDAYQNIRDAYTAWDGGCDPAGANGVVAAINSTVINPQRAQFKHIAFLGGDQLIPMARVADNTLVANEYDFRHTFDGMATGPSATATNALISTMWNSMILSDEPYGDASARAVGDHFLYVTDVALGRVVETPADIVKALDKFVAFNGTLAISTAKVLGYDFLADGSQRVADNLTSNTVGAGVSIDASLANGTNPATHLPWTRADAEQALVAAGHHALVSLNAHFDHYRSLPASGNNVPGYTDDLIAGNVARVLGSNALDQSLVFSMGCHSGLSVSDILIGQTNGDWAQTLTGEGALFVGNSGFGYGDTASVAYTETLMSLFADEVTSPFNLGQGAAVSSSTIGQALAWAKNKYVAGLQTLSVYDEKAVMESTFYGLPFYRVGLTPQPLPAAPTTQVVPDATGTNAARLTVTATNVATTTPIGTYYATTDASGVAQTIVAPGQPIEPKTVRDISVVSPSDPTQLVQVAHGAMVLGMDSTYVDLPNPVINTPVFGPAGNQPEPTVGDVAFPAAPLAITTATGPSGARQDLVLATGQYRADTGQQRLDSNISTVVYYSAPGQSDVAPPTIGTVTSTLVGGRLAIDVAATDAGTGVDRVYALVAQNPGSGPVTWTGVDLAQGSGTNDWVGSLTLASNTTSVEFMIEAKDDAGNVGFATNKADNFDAQPPATPVVPAPPANVLTAAVVGTPAPSGFFNGPVTVRVSASDPTTYSLDGALVGAVPASGAFTITGDGVHTWSVATTSGYTQHGVVVVDATPPVVTPSVPPSTLARAATVDLAVSDPGTGIASVTYSAIGAVTIPATTVAAGPVSVSLTADGTTVITVQATDAAGNVTTQSLSYILDTTPPVVTGAIVDAAGHPLAPNGNGWYASTVRVQWTCVDASTNVAICPGDSFLSTDGSNQTTVSTLAYDLAGNSIAGTVTGINIDLQGPTITGQAVNDDGTPRSPNGAGWYNSAVRVRWTCADTGGAGLAATCPADSYVTTNGANQTATASASDIAGNSTSATVSVNIDTLAPTITGQAVNDDGTPRNANAAGWYDSAVRIRWTCTDTGGSGLAAACPGDSIVGSNGANQTATASTGDQAGNASTTTVSVKIDTAAPAISGQVINADGSPRSVNAAGWYNSAVEVHWTCLDTGGSGIAECPSDALMTTDGINLQTAGTATDVAGNSTRGVLKEINIDSKAPASTADTPCGTTTYCAGSSVNVTITGTDNVSGVTAIHVQINGGADTVYATNPATVQINLGTLSGSKTITFWAVDGAGNAEPINTSVVKYDNVAPLITHTVTPAPNASGWNTANLFVHWDAIDTGGSLVASVTPNASVTTETPSLTLIGTARDGAGNTATDNVLVKLDRTPPTITGKVVNANGTPRLANAAGWYSSAVRIRWTCADVLSGVSSCPADAILTANAAGQSAAGTAIDTAGNRTTAVVSGINIDAAAPTVTGQIINDNGSPRTANTAGWFNAAVRIRWTCTDTGGSGVATCPADTVLSTNGTNQTATASISDAAGNPATASVSGINIDTIVPTITGAASGPMSGGVYTGSVTVHFTCTDTLSGVASCPNDTVLTQVGANQSVTGTAIDKAGNQASSTVSGITIGTTSRAPTVTVTTAAGTHIRSKSGDRVTGTATASGGIASVVVTYTKPGNGTNTERVVASVTIGSTSGGITTYTWSAPAPCELSGATTFVATVTDTSGRKATSPAVSIVITPRSPEEDD